MYRGSLSEIYVSLDVHFFSALYGCVPVFVDRTYLDRDLSITLAPIL